MHKKAANARYFFCLWAVGALGLLTAPLWAADRPSRAAIRSTVDADAAAIAPVQADEPAAPQNAAPQANAVEPTAAPAPLPVLRPYAVATQRSATADLAAVSASSGSFRMLDQAGPKLRMALPMPAGDDLELELERFEVLGPEARFVRAGWNGEIAEPAPRQVLLRGHVTGDPESLAVITMTPEGSSSGFIRRVDAPSVTVYPAGGPRARGGELRVQVGGGSAFPETSEICGVHGGPPLDALLRVQEDEALPRIDRRLRIVNMAIDGDREFVDLFGGDIRAAESYVVQLVATVGEIYRRDLSVKLRLDFMRLWPEGGEPFRADDINSLYRVWFFSGNADRYRVHHLLSGRRDLEYGGVGFADDICGPNGYSISGLLLGSFATPPPLTDLGNWDLYVFGHEVGHNLGTYHTHDGYSPPIDNCPAGEFARGTIMSYCHTTAGGLLNVDLRFHRRVQEYLQFYLRRPCLPRDCNDNGLVDRDEILSGLGVDANGNNTLDECEDCDGNGTRDDLEIAAGAVDADENGIPDSCEPDCNSNGIPDPSEVKDDIDVVDINGNSIPDECEVDCNRNGIADHIDIAAEPRRDLDRDGILDLCQDCDGNRRADWADIQKAHCIYVADSSGRVMEYHPTSGVAVRSYGGGTLVDPQNIVVGPDRALYVTDFVVDGVFRIDVGAGVQRSRLEQAASPALEFDLDVGIEAVQRVPLGDDIRLVINKHAVPLHGATGLAFAPDGRLWVAGYGDNRIAEFSARSYKYLRDLVPPRAGGLLGPRALLLGPDGLLYVADDTSAVRRYTAATGAFHDVFVSPGSGGLAAPRGMAFMPDGRLLVSSYLTDRVLAYAADGSSLGMFTDLFTPTGAWGVAVNPAGNVLVVRHTGDIRILEFDGTLGRYIRSFIRGRHGLTAPTGIAFMPGSRLDANDNLIPDRCE